MDFAVNGVKCGKQKDLDIGFISNLFKASRQEQTLGSVVLICQMRRLDYLIS